MKLNVLALQSGHYDLNQSYHSRLEQLSQHFDWAMETHRDVDLVVFPELMMVPYFCQVQDNRYFSLAELADGLTFQYFSMKAKEAGVYIMVTIFEKAYERLDVKYYNTALIISDKGELVGRYRKTHLPQLSLPTLQTDETFYFQRGREFPVFEIKGFKCGVLICFDRAFPEAARALALQGAELILIPAAAAGEGRKVSWLAECQSRARENGLYVIGVNKAGTEILSEHIQSSFFGLSCGFDPRGEEISVHLDDTPWQEISFSIEKERVRETREQMNLLDFLQGDLYHAIGDELLAVRSYPIKNNVTPLFGPKGVGYYD